MYKKKIRSLTISGEDSDPVAGDFLPAGSSTFPIVDNISSLPLVGLCPIAGAVPVYDRPLPFDR